jgi:hypothetical protein
MINNEKNIAALIISVIALVHSLFACVISIIMFIIIIYHQCNNRLKRINKITLFLCANIYLLIFLYTTGLISLNIYSILGDLYDQNFDSSWCTFTGYFVLAMLCAVYIGFVVQVSNKLD